MEELDTVDAAAKLIIDTIDEHKNSLNEEQKKVQIHMDDAASAFMLGVAVGLKLDPGIALDFYTKMHKVHVLMSALEKMHDKLKD